MDKFINIIETEKCTGCYNCVKSCFPKAIKIDTTKNIVNINRDLCSECGSCTKVCKSNILQFKNSLGELEKLLKNNRNVHAILDSIYQSDFPNAKYNQMKQALLSIGFKEVHPSFTGFALHDYITEQHFKETKNTVIKSFCTPFVDYLEKYYPDLIDNLSPADTPENITSRLIKEQYGDDAITVFISTCSSYLYKNNKYNCNLTVLTTDIIELFEKRNIQPTNFKDTKEQVIAYKTKYNDDNENVDTMEECINLLDALKSKAKIKKIITPYWCNGCFGSPVFKNELSKIEKRLLYKEFKADNFLFKELNDKNISEFGDLNRFKTNYSKKTIHKKVYTKSEIEDSLSSFGRTTPAEKFNCGACGYSTCEELAIAILNDMASPEQCTPNLPQQLKSVVDKLDNAYTELDSAFALTIPNSRLEIKLKHTVEYQDIFIRETGKIKIIGVIEDGGYRHVVNALKVAADLHSKGVMNVIGFDKDTIVKTIIFHDIGKSQPKLEIGQEVSPSDFFENGKLHAERSAELALANYKNEGINEDIYLLIKYHHHNENELPIDFPQHLLPMYRLFRLIDGISAGLTRRNSFVNFDLIGSTLYIKEYSQHPNYRCFYSIDLYKPEYLRKQYDFQDTLETIKHSDKYKK